MMRASTLKALPADVGGLLAYYTGLADDPDRRDGARRGAIDYYLARPSRLAAGGGHGPAALGLGAEVQAEQLERNFR